MAVLNDGKPTIAARFQQGCDLSAPDITIVNSEAADRFSWQPLNEWERKSHKLSAVIALLLLRPPSGNCLSDSLSIAFPGGWRRSRSSARVKPGSARAVVPPTNASDFPSSLAMAFSRQIRNEPSLRSSIILRHMTLSGEPVCSRRCLISESRCASCIGWRHGLQTALLASNSTE